MTDLPLVTGDALNGITEEDLAIGVLAAIQAIQAGVVLTMTDWLSLTDRQRALIQAARRILDAEDALRHETDPKRLLERAAVAFGDGGKSLRMELMHGIMSGNRGAN